MIHHGDCLAVLPMLDADSFDAAVTDPPYHLTSIVKRFGGANAAPAQHGTDGAFARASRGFMGKTWDGGDVALRPETWAEVLRVLKPGAHLAAFGGTRTFHRMAVAIEDAGFEIRDTLMWVYASGFPKSHDTERAVALETCPLSGRHFARTLPPPGQRKDGDHICPVTPESEPRDGYGTALKPAWEPIILARKPLDGTVAANVLRHGTGALNIDATRISAATSQGAARSSRVDSRDGTSSWRAVCRSCRTEHTGIPAWSAESLAGNSRLPANETGRAGERQRPLGSPGGYPPCPRCGGELVREVAEGGQAPAQQRSGGDIAHALDAKDARSHEGLSTSDNYTAPHVEQQGRWPANVVHDGSPEVVAAFPDAPGQQRPLHGGEASKAEIYGKFGPKLAHTPRNDSGSAARFFYSAKADAADRLGSKHPTVKPVDLMRWLVRLVTPPGGLILDPFAGSGTTGMAAMAEGMRAVLIEREAEYVADIKRRLAHVKGEDAPLFAGGAA